MNSRPQDFHQVYAEFGPKLYRFCLRLSGNRADAEDLTQDVFVATLTGRERFRGRSSYQTYLYRIAVNKHRAKSRRARREAPLIDEHLWPGGFDEATVLLDEAIARLPEDLREAFILVKAEQLTSAEAAEVLQIPDGTVRYHVHEAIQRLRSALRDLEPSATRDYELPRKPNSNCLQ